VDDLGLAHTQKKTDVKSRLIIRSVLGLCKNLPQLLSRKEAGLVLQRMKINEDKSKILL